MITMNRLRQPTLPCVVLAAGRSRRLGRSKAALRIHGLSLLVRTVRRLAALRVGPVLVVLPPRATRLRQQLGDEGARGIVNADPGRGLASSVRRGLEATRCARAVLLIPVDLVHLKQRDIERLVRRWRAHPRRVIARRLEGAPAIPLILPMHLRVHALSLEGDQGLRRVLARRPAAELELLDLPSAASDLDTPADLEAARSLRQLARARTLRRDGRGHRRCLPST